MAGNNSTRSEETKRERRRKRGSTVMPGINLAVDESKLDRANYEYRWVNDKGPRMQQMHSDDWDPAPEAAALQNEGEGTVQKKVVGSTDDGKPYNAVLMRKPKDWYAEDQKEKMKPMEDWDNQIRRGNAHQESELREGAYTPGSNTIDRS